MGWNKVILCTNYQIVYESQIPFLSSDCLGKYRYRHRLLSLCFYALSNFAFHGFIEAMFCNSVKLVENLRYSNLTMI